MALAADDPRLKKRTRTNLYNERPQWLKLAHEKLARLRRHRPRRAAGRRIWTDAGAGQPLPPEHPLATERQRVDRVVLANLLRLNGLRNAI